MRLALGLYRLPSYDGRDSQLMASADVVLNPADIGAGYTVVLNPRWGSSATYYRAELRPLVNDALVPLPGWASLLVGLNIDQTMIGHNDSYAVPAAVYTNEATDWPTGVVRFCEICADHEWPGQPAPYKGEPRYPAATWVLTLRRAG